MIEVKVKIPGNEVEFDKAVRLFKKIVNKEGFLQEIKERRYFEKKSDRKRRERKEKIRRK